MVTHSSILVWRIPWTEEPGELHRVAKIKQLGTHARTCADTEHVRSGLQKGPWPAGLTQGSSSGPWDSKDGRKVKCLNE